MTDGHDSAHSDLGVDPETAAQLDAADSHQDPAENDGPRASGPDPMSEVIERRDEERTHPENGEPPNTESLSEGSEW